MKFSFMKEDIEAVLSNDDDADMDKHEQAVHDIAQILTKQKAGLNQGAILAHLVAVYMVGWKPEQRERRLNDWMTLMKAIMPLVENLLSPTWENDK